MLKVAGHDMGPGEIDEFVDNVSKLSHSSLRISLEPDLHGSDINFQEEYIADAQAGRYDMILMPARAWHILGNNQFDPFIAPFLIDSYRLEESVIESGLGKPALDSLAPLQLVGIGLVPGVIRHPIGVHQKILTLTDIAGKTFGVFSSPIGEQAVTAMGAIAKRIRPTFPASGLDAGEEDLEGAANLLYDINTTALTTNLDLWPRLLTLVMNSTAYGSLTAEQQQVLRQAALDSVPAKIANLLEAETRAVKQLCDFGYPLVEASDAERAAFKSSVQPVIATISSDPVAASVIASIQDLAATTPADTIKRTCT